MTHNDDEPVAHPAAVTDLAADLAERRALDDTRRRDRRKRCWSRALHRIDLSDLREQVATTARERRERRESAHGDSALARLHRSASLAGERARLSAQIKQSGEVRALRVQRVRVVSLAVLIPVLVAFAAWSTAGVHHGFVTLLGLTAGSAMWVTGWGVEPALVTIVAGIIIVRAVLRSSGGDLDWRATVAEWVALSTSIALNMAGHWPESVSLATVVALIAHSIGPLGAAGTAWLLGIVDDAVSHADPWAGAQKLEELDLGERANAHRSTARPVSTAQPEPITGERPVPAQGERPSERQLLSENDYQQLLSAPDERAPVEPPADHRSERSSVHSATAERRSLVAELLTENPDMTGPEIAEALGERLGRPVSAATAKRDRAAVQQERA